MMMVMKRMISYQQQKEDQDLGDQVRRSAAYQIEQFKCVLVAVGVGERAGGDDDDQQRPGLAPFMRRRGDRRSCLLSPQWSPCATGYTGVKNLGSELGALAVTQTNRRTPCAGWPALTSTLLIGWWSYSNSCSCRRRFPQNSARDPPKQKETNGEELSKAKRKECSFVIQPMMSPSKPQGRSTSANPLDFFLSSGAGEVD
jgi:hypothetical protein